MNDLEDYTKYLSAWCWQILAIIFLCFGFLFLALPTSLISNVFFISFILIFIGCEAMAIKRRKEFYENN